jgi:hypothetical protein
MTPFDRNLALRSLGYTTLACVVAAGVTVLTDEPDASAAWRLARISAFLPALAALGSALSLSQARARGELRAIEALGVSPLRAGLGASVSAWLVGALGLILLLSRAADLRALFPTATATPAWVRVGAELWNPLHGVSVGPAGALRFTRVDTWEPSGVPPHELAALFALAPLALMLPIWITGTLSSTWRALAGVSAFALLVVLLHAVAAARVHCAWLALPALPIATQALMAHWRTL